MVHQIRVWIRRIKRFYKSQGGGDPLAKFNRMVRTVMISFTFLLYLSASGQMTHYFILNSDSSASVPFAHVQVLLDDSVLFQGTTGSSGDFYIDRRVFPEKSTLKISHVSYKPFECLIHNQETATFYLQSKVHELNTLVISKADEKVQSFVLGSKSKKEDIFHCGRQGSQIAVFFELPKNVEYGYLTQIEVLISEHSQGVFPFRVHLYKGNGNPSIPPNDSKEMQTTQIIGNSINGGGWVKFDLTDQYIRLDSNGAYCSLEWLSNDTLKIYEVPTFDKCTATVPNMCIAKSHAKYSNYVTWLKTPTKHKGWYRSLEKPNTRISNPIVKGKLEIIK